MKTLKLISFILLFANAKIYAQDLTEKINKSIRFGFSAGVENKFNTPNDAYLDPSSLNLEFDNLSKTSFVISTSIVYMPNYIYRTVSYKQEADGSKTATYGNWEYKSSRWGAVASLNLAEYTSDGNFNKRIDGGIGVAFAPGKIQKDKQTGKYDPHPFYLSLTLDFSTMRQLRDGIKNKYTGKQILIDEKPLNALDRSDNSLFMDKVFTGVSFKFIYLLN